MCRSAFLTSLLLVLSLVACGGGGGGGDKFTDTPVTTGGFNPPGGGTGGGSGSGTGTGTFEWNGLANGGAPTVTSTEIRIARNQAEYDALTAIITVSEWESVPPPSGPPSIDFSERMVVAVFLGTRPLSRARVDIANITRQGDGIHVDYVELNPVSPPCPPDPGIPTQPCVLATCTPMSGPATMSGTIQNVTCTNP